VKKERPRVAFFSCVYHEMDGVAKTTRHFEAYAERNELPLLMIHAGPRNEITSTGSVTNIELKRSPLKFPLDRAHEFDLLFWRHRRKLEPLLRHFRPDMIQITGPSDVGMLGTWISQGMGIPLAATWQTNLHQYARRRAAAALSFVPQAITSKPLEAMESASFTALARYYRIPKLLFAPNRETVQSLEAATGKPCFLMSHAVDTDVFKPEFRNRQGGPFQIGYVGRLTTEKGVRQLARLEEALLSTGHQDFRIVVVGEGGEEAWLRKHLRQADFRGVLTGPELSRAFADFDLLAFPSETDTFGLVVLEALASGVPAVVTGSGGPKYSVEHGITGYVANSFDEFVGYTASLMDHPNLLSTMRTATREQALKTSWDQIFDGMYESYENVLFPSVPCGSSVFDVATS
jgi:phosphatidylinositol alpha 1,6-mannosyltransferase